MSWSDLVQANQELAEFGRQCFASEVAFLATLRKDGSPRVHPVKPIIGEERLFVFIDPSSPKRRDLRRDGCYALHSSVADSSGGEGEFFVSGRPIPIEYSATRQIAAASAGYEIVDRYVLFDLKLDAAFSTIYSGDHEPICDRWKRKV
jgi:hypothetical protein